jgi:hypothetical protein
MAESKVLEQAAEELYGLPPGEFTRARDERAKAIRKEGDREAADAVKALRKPTVAAWALNQLARRRTKELQGLLSAGEELRAAQEELLGGGGRSAFQEKAAQERELVAKLSADAASLAGEAGERASGLQEKVAATLHAAALDDETADELRAGRLVREREAIGGFGSVPAAAPAGAPSSKKTQRKPKGKQTQRVAAARTDERHARRELEAAEKAVEHAQERADAADAHAKEAAERARTNAERLKEARRAATAARKAHTRAERALEKADSSSPAKS